MTRSHLGLLCLDSEPLGDQESTCTLYFSDVLFVPRPGPACGQSAPQDYTPPRPPRGPPDPRPQAPSLPPSACLRPRPEDEAEAGSAAEAQAASKLPCCPLKSAPTAAPQGRVPFLLVEQDPLQQDWCETWRSRLSLLSRAGGDAVSVEGAALLSSLHGWARAAKVTRTVLPGERVALGWLRAPVAGPRHSWSLTPLVALLLHIPRLCPSHTGPSYSSPYFR